MRREKAGEEMMIVRRMTALIWVCIATREYICFWRIDQIAFLNQKGFKEHQPPVSAWSRPQSVRDASPQRWSSGLGARVQSLVTEHTTDIKCGVIVWYFLFEQRAANLREKTVTMHECF